MTLAINDDFAKRELSSSELDVISAGLYNGPPSRPFDGGHEPFWGGIPPYNGPGTTWAAITRDGVKPICL
jgi:hypothetical protein